MGGYGAYRELLDNGSSSGFGEFEGIMTVLLVLWSIYGSIPKSTKESLMINIDKEDFSVYIKIVLGLALIVTFTESAGDGALFLIGMFVFTFLILKLNSKFHKSK